MKASQEKMAENPIRKGMWELRDCRRERQGFFQEWPQTNWKQYRSDRQDVSSANLDVSQQLFGRSSKKSNALPLVFSGHGDQNAYLMFLQPTSRCWLLGRWKRNNYAPFQ